MLVPLAVAVRPVGAPGAVAVAASVVVLATLEEVVPVPMLLMAETR